MYHTTAFLYEATAAFEQPEQVCERILSIFDEQGLVQPGRLGDFGSGTGLISIPLAENGWQVTGVELSAGMLEVARQKAAHLSEEVRNRLRWMQGDIADMALPVDGPLDGAVCLCNTINHLAAWSQVEGFIRSAYRVIRPGGILILDSDTLETFRGYFHHPPTVVWEDGTHRLTRACQFDEVSGHANHLATLERFTPEGWITLSEEPLALQYHPEARLNQAFLVEGFNLVSAEPFNPFPALYQGFVPKVLWTFRRG